MPKGWFAGPDEDFAGHPFVAGTLFLPRLGVVGIVDFLVDTGCSVTTLHPRDALDMGVDFSLLAAGRTAFGVGGSQREYTEPAELSFPHAPRRSSPTAFP